MTLGSFNINGIKDKKKLKRLLSVPYAYQIDILCLQEIRGVPDSRILRNERRYQMIYSAHLDDKCSEGVAILYDSEKISLIK